MTDAELKELEKLAAAALDPLSNSSHSAWVVCSSEGALSALAARARVDIPRLVAEVRALRARARSVIVPADVLIRIVTVDGVALPVDYLEYEYEDGADGATKELRIVVKLP